METTELKESRISTRVTKLLKVDIDNTAKQMNIKPAELLREAVEAYLSQADVHVELKSAIKEYNKLKEVMRLGKIQIDDLKVDLNRANNTIDDLEDEAEKLADTIREERNNAKTLKRALENAHIKLNAIANRGVFRRIFNLKPKQPKQEKRTWDTPSAPITPTREAE